jgi:hypothetical protein
MSTVRANPRSGNHRPAKIGANGYKVIVNKLSDVPLDQATVIAIRPGRPVTQRVTDSGGDSIDKVLYTTVYVDVQ